MWGYTQGNRRRRFTIALATICNSRRRIPERSGRTAGGGSFADSPTLAARPMWGGGEKAMLRRRRCFTVQSILLYLQIINLNCRSMSHVRLFYHIVFVTRHRADVIPERHEKLLFKYIYSVCIDKGVKLIRINGTQCHIHMLVGMPATMCVADFMREIKRSTSLMLKRTPGFDKFMGWAREYSCDTVSFHHVDIIKGYIINQKRHHLSTNLIDELRELFDQDEMSFE